MLERTPEETAPIGPTATDDPTTETVREDGRGFVKNYDGLVVDPSATADTVGADANGS